MKTEKMIEVEDNDYSNLTENEHQELFYLNVMFHAISKFPRKMKKQMKKRRNLLDAKVIKRTKFISQRELDESLPF